MTVEKFLEFQGKKITLVNQDGSFYVALKPICEVLELDWSNERRRLNRHGWIGKMCTLFYQLAADGKKRQMVCLPEKYIYGWIYTMIPRDDKMVKIQADCYNLLYSYFHQ